MSERELPKGFVSASHAILFAETEERCSVCSMELADDAAEDAEGEGFTMAGRGLFVWSRGDERRYEEPRLCAGCASAIGVSALQRWEIEEDEG